MHRYVKIKRQKTDTLYDTIRHIICTEKLTGQFNLAHELKEN